MRRTAAHLVLPGSTFWKQAKRTAGFAPAGLTANRGVCPPPSGPWGPFSSYALFSALRAHKPFRVPALGSACELESETPSGEPAECRPRPLTPFSELSAFAS